MIDRVVKLFRVGAEQLAFVDRQRVRIVVADRKTIVSIPTIRTDVPSIRGDAKAESGSASLTDRERGNARFTASRASIRRRSRASNSL
ncbi:hypothetical protein [Burkholderia dolosa]|uniref:hypothetical protein n=1 Tax=Burkholderia dolosa TaxID=152500 RepID=UPI001BA5AFF4|nr:hypothetical protein [Burkholderia dolosa]